MATDEVVSEADADVFAAFTDCTVCEAPVSAAARDDVPCRLSEVEAEDLGPLRGAGAELAIGRKSTQVSLHPKAHSPPPHKWHAPTDRTGQITRHV